MLGKSPGNASRARERFGLSEEELVPEGIAEGAEMDSLAVMPAPSRRRVSPFFRPLDSTKEWTESYYDRRRFIETSPELINVNEAWLDFAMAGDDAPFVPSMWHAAHSNRHEALLMLALLDLPFEAAEHAFTKDDDGGLRLTAGSRAMVYYETYEPASESDAESPILVNQRYFDPQERVHVVEGRTRDRLLDRDGYIVHKVYGCRVSVTNASAGSQAVRVLLQIPAALSLSREGVGRGLSRCNWNRSQARRWEYYFYFPRPGEYAHYPVQVFYEGRLLAHADPGELLVAEQPTRQDPESWNYVSQFGSDAQVLQYLSDKNVHRVALKKIAFRMRDAAFFRQVLELLRSRHRIEPTLWSYALLHKDPAAARELLALHDDFIERCGEYLRSPLLDIDGRRKYEHLEYAPLVNSRAHRLGTRWQIANPAAHAQYERFLKLASHKPILESQDWLEATYYLLLQDRVEQAIENFVRVQRDDVADKMQYDYMRAYLDCRSGNAGRARAIAESYDDYPVTRWRSAFAAVLAMLDELDGRDSGRARNRRESARRGTCRVRCEPRDTR